MGAVGLGRLLFALGFAVVGAIGLGAHDFVLSQQPVPQGIPSREMLASISGALLLVTGVGLLVPRAARVAALVLTAYLALWVLALQLPRALAAPQVMGYWLGVGEDLTLATGAWAIFCAITSRNDETLRVARILFGVALLPIGLSHFFYLQITVGFIPAWFPFRPFLAGFTGAAHIAAGLALIFGIVPRLAATLEAIMETLFTVFVWITAVVHAPTKRDDWVNLFISTALSAAAWAVAESYRREPRGLTLSNVSGSRHELSRATD
jgi:uncharacterized membrane protein YphA (DoxX/SURF4 family)